MDNNKNVKSQKNGKIELLRFLFSIAILLGHASTKQQLDLGLLKVGKLLINNFFGLGVEFFFMVSGFFLAKSAFQNVKNTEDIGESGKTIIYTFRKLLSIYPIYVVCYLITLFLYIVLLDNNSKIKNLEIIIRSIPSLLLIQKHGFLEKTMGHAWYLSDLLIIGSIVYLLILKYRNIFSRIVCFILPIFIIGYINVTTSTLLDTSAWLLGGVVPKHCLRCLSELMLGVLIYEIVMYLKKCTIKPKLLLSVHVFEIMCEIACFYLINQSKKEYNVYFLLFLFFELCIVFSENHLFKKIYNNPVFYYLGKLSLYIYIYQTIFRYILFDYLENIQF